jgi:hypothetical protein
MVETHQSTITSNIGIIPWYVKDLVLPLLVTFITYLIIHIIIYPFNKWQEIREKAIIFVTQYANYKAYSYTAKDGKKKCENYELYHTVTQDLRELAGRVDSLQYDCSYKIWKKAGLLPDNQKISRIQGDLIGWASTLIEKNLTYDPERELRIESLKKDLGLPNFQEQIEKSVNSTSEKH